MDAGLSNAALGLGAEDKGDDPRLGLADDEAENASLVAAAKPAATPSAPHGGYGQNEDPTNDSTRTASLTKTLGRTPVTGEKPKTGRRA